MRDMTWWADPAQAAAALEEMKPGDRRAVEEFLAAAQPYLRQAAPVANQPEVAHDTQLTAGPVVPARRHWNPVALLVLGILAAPVVGYGLTWWLLSNLGR